MIRLHTLALYRRKGSQNPLIYKDFQRTIYLAHQRDAHSLLGRKLPLTVFCAEPTFETFSGPWPHILGEI